MKQHIFSMKYEQKIYIYIYKIENNCFLLHFYSFVKIELFKNPNNHL